MTNDIEKKSQVRYQLLAAHTEFNTSTSSDSSIVQFKTKTSSSNKIKLEADHTQIMHTKRLSGPNSQKYKLTPTRTIQLSSIQTVKSFNHYSISNSETGRRNCYSLTKAEISYSYKMFLGVRKAIVLPDLCTRLTLMVGISCPAASLKFNLLYISRTSAWWKKDGKYVESSSSRGVFTASCMSNINRSVRIIGTTPEKVVRSSNNG